jgi:zinc transporter
MRNADGVFEWLSDACALDETTATALLEGSTRPRVTPMPGGTLCTLRGVNLNEGAEPDDMISLRLWIEKDRLISIRREYFTSVKQVMDGLRAGNGPETLGGVVAQIAEALTDRVDTIVDAAEETLDDLEDRILSSSGDTRSIDMDSLGSLRRQLLTIYRHLAPQLTVLDKLDEILPNDFFPDDDRRRLTESENQLRRIVEDLDSAKSRAAVLQDQIEVRLASRLNRRLYLISIIATVALPLTLLTGMLGMNVGGLPLEGADQGFLIVALGMVVASIVALILLRMANWL